MKARRSYFLFTPLPLLRLKKCFPSCREIEEEALAAIRAAAIREALAQAGGRIGLTANLLGVHLGTLYERMEHLGIDLVCHSTTRQILMACSPPRVGQNTESATSEMARDLK